MRSRKPSTELTLVLAALVVTGLATVSASAQQEKVLRSFIMNGQDASEPYAGVIFDKAGNLYGTTRVGGTSEAGTVYKLKPKAGGGWTESLLHSFIVGATDGRSPHGGLVIDASGNLYGPTSYGGAHDDGTIFELSPDEGGSWTETVLHSFNINTDGYQPIASLIFDGGNLYGTTSGGGTGTNCGKVGCGTVFELSPQPGGGWSETTLHNFANNGKDGTIPNGIIFDAKGNLFGTTVQGGHFNDGVVFELSPKAGGEWTESILHDFDYNGTDGYYPHAGVILDSSGNLYGTTYLGGAYSSGGGGTVFELSPAAGGRWTETILYSFNNLGTGPYYPVAGLTLDSSGNLYGTTEAGGRYGWGTVFELKPAGGGTWTERTLHTFVDNGKDGFGPVAGVLLDASHNLYGTTPGGGAQGGAGTVFEIIP